ncbi:ZZEF1 isoform 1 [Pongo abelii]|uniref:ZZEF1 isoform 1 n=1 Tax=Pongo abelii TaxID=9601 RepID=A0A2J8SPG2_PONAB|nr:ZZEF1 isoform 1 [Pongo abelii]
MGNAPSHSSEDEAAAAGGEGWGPHQDWAAVSGTTPGPGLAAPALPPAAALLEPARLREAAAALLPTPPCESLVSRHRGALFRWLEERLGRGEESVTLEQFRELLEARGAGCSSEQFEEAFAQFDAEGDGTVDAENMLEALKNSSGANLQGELSHIIRQLQACSLVPGFTDIFSESKEGLDSHSSMILRFLHRNRLSSAVMPYPMLEHCNTVCTMRSSVLKEALDQLVQKEKESPGDLTRSPEMDKLKSVAKCYAYIETSSNSADIDKMTNGETSSYWQSDGSACSHWIRLKMKPDVVLRHLSIAVAATDQSYMPQQVTVAVGRNASDLQEVRDVHIPSNVTGYVTLLENANVSQLYVQINIKRCLSDGCDTRIHGLRAVGFQRVKKSGVSVSDASAIWYWSLLTSLVTASMETNPAFVQTVLHNTQKALRHMPPLSLSPGSTDFSTFLSPNVLEEVDSFLIRITSCCSTPEVELTLLAFALARGSVAKVMSSLCTITDHLDTQYDASSLILSMASVRQNLLLKYGKPLQLTLQACDVKGKEDKSGPENLLVEPWTRDEEHFKRFEKYDKWKLQELRQFVKSRIGCSSDDLGEDDPIGWFELEEEWDEADVKLQQCRVAKYLMVKFLCTRQESAERLGVQGLSISGYLRPARAEAEQSVTCAHCRKDTEESVCGATLLLRTLQFIQQLAHDLVQQKESGLKYKSFLDFAGLDLQIFWNFYSKLKQNPREECISAQTLLLQLLQSCFSVLQGDVLAASEEEKAPIQSPKGAEAAKELYTHLCDVVDKVDGDSVPMEILKQEVRNTLLNGAAIFFPNRQTRRNHLFTMMKNVTEQEHKQSLQLTFRSLCTYFSDKDPGGLLLLPEKNDLAKMNISEVLAVMDTLLSVAARECELLMLSGAPGEVGSVLFSLFWSVQGSLLSWCYLQLKSTDSGAKDLAMDLIEKYVGQFLASMRVILESLLSQYSGKTIVERLCNSVFSMAARQLVIFLLDFCALDIPHCALLREFSVLTELLKKLCSGPEGGLRKLDVETWQQEQPVVLHTWTKESAHNYENNCHEVSVFVSPGATYFEVEFDDRCETEKRYDYLEFTDARGRKTRYDTKVGTDKWPKKVTFKAGPRLQFLFHSDSSHNEWGYKFTVTAYGLPDVAVSWGLDLQLLVSRLMGRLASQCMALKSVHQLGSNMVVPQAKMALVLSSPLWKPVFRHQVKNIPDDPCRHFLLDFAQSEPAQNFCGPYSELFKGFIQACRKQAPKTDIVAGSTIDQAVNATFAALVYRTPDLYEKLQKYAKECIEKSLLLLKFLPTGISSKESCEKLETADETNHLHPLDKRQRTSSVVEEHFQASVSPTEAAPPATGDRSPGLDTQPKLPSSSGLPAADVSPATAEEPLSPSTPTRRPPFTRGRLRLLSFRSMEEARLVPTVKEKYPVLKDVMDFIKDQSLSHRSVVKVLSLRKAQAQSILEVLKITQYCAESLGQPHCFHPPFILFLLELLTCQKDFTKSLLPALSCVQTALLHLLDMGWEPSDLAFFVDIQLPDLLMKMSQENISVHDSVISQWSEEDELADAKQNSEWMDECQDGMFEAWYEKIAQEDPEKQRKMHMFIARYCDLLNVDISCDGCDEIAPWHRYRCLQCSDMDLCKTCFLGGVKPEGHGDDHEMVNMEFTCDHCQGLIIGRRMNCNVCDDFDLCYGCYAAKKYSYGHLPTHSITAHPMVTIRISDRQRLIQPYIHNYSWLLFAALALYSAHLASAEDVDGEKLDPQTRSSATTLRSQCMQLVGDCLMKAHQGKDAEDSEASSQKPIEEKAVTPSPEQVFAECSQKRILGLLAAMLPPLKSVLCVGTRCVYMDNANEPHNVIILKHFTEKNRAVIVDVKTRKRKTVKDYQLVQKGGGQECGDSQAQLSQYSQHFAFIASHLLQSSMDSHCPEAVEATWVLSLALKGLYKTLKILSIMLYSSKKEINALAEHGDLELDERGDREEEVERPVSSPGDPEQKKLDPLEGLDEPTRICFLMAHDALSAPLHILRAIYELQMKKTDYFFLEVQKRFDGDELTTDERIRSLAQRWQPSKSLRLEEQSAKAVDTDMIILPCLSRPARCDQATAESNPVTQKLISSTESELQQSYAKQRRSKSAALLHKELNCKSKRAVRDYLFRVNEATAVLYARHVLASLLAEWPSHVPVSEDILELSGPAHMTYILDMFMQLEEKHEWEKILQKVLQGCREDMLGTMALAACQFMEEPGMEVQVRESKHPYNNNTNFEDKVHIPGAIYLSIKFDSQCNTEEGCDELAMSSSSDFQQDRHSFSGSQQKWKDFELPGDTLYYRFTSDMSNTEWGYRFTVTAGHLGRFQTGFEILKQMLSEERVVPHLPLAKIWEWLVGVACRQTGHQRLKAIHLLLRIVRCCGHSDLCDLALLKPLWQLFTHMEYGLFEDVTQPGILLPLHRALTELFFVTENRAQELGVLQDYLLALTTDDHLLRCAAQVDS